MMLRIFTPLLILGALIPQFTFAADLSTIHKQLVAKNNLAISQQAFCLQDPDGTTQSYRPTARVIPASVSKVYTFDFALAKLGKDFRYKTDFILNDSTLYINGGGDPHFVIENLEAVIKQMSPSSPIKKIVFSPNFYFNWKQTSPTVKSALISALKNNKNISVDKNLAVAYSAKKYSGAGSIYTFESAPLSILMKQINDYSTNISSDVLIERAGGYSEFQKYMKQVYGADTNTVKFGTGSGLKNNYTTCELTLKVLKHFEQSLHNVGLQITDVMSVPGRDPGVVSKRLAGLSSADNVVLKSGFINYHQNLAGVINTEKGHVYFAVFGTYKNMNENDKTKLFVDTFVEKIVQNYTALPYAYDVKSDVFGFTKITKVN
ncbi:MAG TPA: D-alanyl-D-alanine carboxypeptidase [Candidatus Paceibacterota bacterium]